MSRFIVWAVACLTAGWYLGAATGASARLTVPEKTEASFARAQADMDVQSELESLRMRAQFQHAQIEMLNRRLTTLEGRKRTSCAGCRLCESVH